MISTTQVERFAALFALNHRLIESFRSSPFRCEYEVKDDRYHLRGILNQRKLDHPLELSGDFDDLCESLRPVLVDLLSDEQKFILLDYS